MSPCLSTSQIGYKSRVPPATSLLRAAPRFRFPLPMRLAELAIGASPSFLFPKSPSTAADPFPAGPVFHFSLFQKLVPLLARIPRWVRTMLVGSMATLEP